MKKILLFLGAAVLNFTTNAYPAYQVECRAPLLHFLSNENSASAEINPIVAVYRRIIQSAQRTLPRNQLPEMLATGSYFLLPNSQNSLGLTIQDGLYKLRRFARSQLGVDWKNLELLLQEELRRVVEAGEIEAVTASENIQIEKVVRPLSIRIERREGLGPQLLFSPVDTLAVVNRHQFFDVIDPKNGDLVQVEGNSKRQNSSLDFSPDGKYLIWKGLSTRWVEVYDVRFRALLFSDAKGASYFIRPGFQELVKITPTHIQNLEITSGKLIRENPLSERLVQSFTMDPSGKYALFHGSGNDYLSLWDLSQGQLKYKIPRTSKVIPTFRFSSTGKFLFMADRRESVAEVRVIDTESGRSVGSQPCRSKVLFSSRDTYFVTWSGIVNNTEGLDEISVHHTASNRTVIAGVPLFRPTFVFSNDERFFFVSANSDCTRCPKFLFRMYDLSTGQLLLQLNTPIPFQQAALSSDGRRVILFFKNGQYLVYAISEKREILSSRISNNSRETYDALWAISPNGEYAVFQSHAYGSTYILDMKRFWNELSD